MYVTGLKRIKKTKSMGEMDGGGGEDEERVGARLYDDIEKNDGGMGMGDDDEKGESDEREREREKENE